MRKIINTYTCGGLTAVYRTESKTNMAELILVPAGMANKIARTDCAAAGLVQTKLFGDDNPAFFSSGRTMACGVSAALTFDKQTVENTQSGIAVKTVLLGTQGCTYTHTLYMYNDNPAAEVEVTVKNAGTNDVRIELLTSFVLGAISPFANGLCAESLLVHRLRSRWSAEGRLTTDTAESLQLEPSWKGYSANSERFGSVGSYPVHGYFPFCALEDIQSGVTWAAAPTHGSSWQIELYRQDNGLTLMGGLADKELGHFEKCLAAGKSFTTPRAVVTAVKGGVDSASHAICESSRRHLMLTESEKAMPVIFNEFCTTWGAPTQEKILAQLEIFKNRGIGVYVIDAGWYDERGFESGSKLGKWEVSRRAFPNGLKAAADAIHAAGMQAGLWFEPEIAGRDEPECFNDTENLLTLDGVPITCGDRRFWDMRKASVRALLDKIMLDTLRKNGFDYVKSDYNECLGIGCDGAESVGEGLRVHIEAVQAFYTHLRSQLPQVTFELCASGGHRLCQSFLRLACMASFSDAHECDEIPIIAANMHRIMLPRQSQIWAVLRAEHTLQKLYYQICSGLLGRLYFSGDIDSLSNEQWSVIESGISFYKLAAPVIDIGESVRLGTEIKSYREPRGWQTILRKGRTHTLLVVHTFNDAPKQLCIEAGGSLAHIFARVGLRIDKSAKSLCISGLECFDAAAVLLTNEEI